MQLNRILPEAVLPEAVLPEAVLPEADWPAAGGCPLLAGSCQSRGLFTAYTRPYLTARSYLTDRSSLPAPR
jgi:hypothetical protein